MFLFQVFSDMNFTLQQDFMATPSILVQWYCFSVPTKIMYGSLGTDVKVAGLPMIMHGAWV